MGRGAAGFQIVVAMMMVSTLGMAHAQDRQGTPPDAIDAAPGAKQTRQDDRPRVPRLIAPSRVAPPPVDPSTLKRAEPRPPLSPLAQPLPPLEKRKTVRRLQKALHFRPVAVAAGRLEVEDEEIVIAGIRTFPPDQLCDGDSGGTWPCGMRARTAFRYWLRGRAVICTPAGKKTDGEEEAAATKEAMADCSLAGDDVAAWLVKHGWALALPDSRYEAAGEKAREERKGIFSGGLPGT